MEPLTIAAVLALGSIALVGAYQDIRYRLLPNWLSVAALIGGLGFGLARLGPPLAAMSLVHALIALLAGMALFAMRLFGGGDAKFYAGLAGWFPLSQAGQFAAATALAGLVFALIWLAAGQRRLRRAGNGQSKGDFAKLPYGVAISSGALIAYVHGIA